MGVSTEKDLESKVDMIEISNKYAKLGIAEEDAAFYEQFGRSPEHKEMVRKIDFRLVPFLFCLYLAAHIDRANIGNAKIEGMIREDRSVYNLVQELTARIKQAG